MKLTEEKRLYIIEQLAQQWTKAQSLQDLEYFFYDSQVDFLASREESDLLDIATEYNLIDA